MKSIHYANGSDKQSIRFELICGKHCQTTVTLSSLKADREDSLGAGPRQTPPVNSDTNFETDRLTGMNDTLNMKEGVG